jgi:deoxycytidylate deaminase
VGILLKTVPFHIQKLAEKLALRSTMRYHLSAIIFNNKGHIISIGYNKWLLSGYRETKPYKSSIHAEMDALIGCSRQELKGSSIYVFRSNYRMARPCNSCMSVIIAAGIKNIFYSNENGEI